MRLRMLFEVDRESLKLAALPRPSEKLSALRGRSRETEVPLGLPLSVDGEDLRDSGRIGLSLRRSCASSVVGAFSAPWMRVKRCFRSTP